MPMYRKRMRLAAKSLALLANGFFRGCSQSGVVEDEGLCCGSRFGCLPGDWVVVPTETYAGWVADLHHDFMARLYARIGWSDQVLASDQFSIGTDRDRTIFRGADR